MQRRRGISPSLLSASGRVPAGRAPVPRLAAALTAMLLPLVLASPLAAQGRGGARVPVETVQRVMTAEFSLCDRTENATASELDAIAAEIRQAIDQAQRRVDRLVADSAAAARALKDAQDKVTEVDKRLGPLQAERNKVLSDMQVYDDQLIRLEQGNAPAGEPSEHAQLMQREKSLRERIAQLTAEVEKARQLQGSGPMNPLPTQGDDVQRFFQNMASDDGPVGPLKEAVTELNGVMARLRAIRRETHPIRFGAEYTALQRRLDDLNRRIGEIETELNTATRARDRAKTAWENFDLRGLDRAHEENLYVYEHFMRAQHCVEKRRRQLNQEAPPVSTSAAGSASGRWGVFCRFNDPDYGQITDGGTFTITLDGRGGVAGTYVSDMSNYAVSGSVAPDGSASGAGSGGGWSVSWSGRLGQTAGGTVGNGGVNVTITSFGGGSCSGTWSIP